jgi:hypothetical protein
LSLFAARIKVKANASGLIPEFVDVIGNFEVFYLRISPAVWSNRLSVPGDHHHLKTARSETMIAGELPRWCQSLNCQKTGAYFPAKLPEGAAGKFSASDSNLLEKTRHSEAWRRNVLEIKKGDSGVLQTGNVLGSGNGAEAWERADRNA